MPIQREPTATWNPDRDVWEIDQTDLFSGLSDVFSETWPHSGSMRSGRAYARPTPEPPTVEPACSSLLPTPAVNDMGAGKTPDAWDAWTDRMRAEHSNGNGHGKSLSVETLRLLPTPLARDGNGPKEATNKEGGPNLPGALHLLATPRVSADRTSRTAAMRADSRSGPSLMQCVEIAQGVLPREFDTWAQLPLSWHGGRTSERSDGGSDS